MKKLNKRLIPKISLLSGVCLIVVGALVLISWQWRIFSSVRKSEAYVQTIYSLIPQPQGSVPEERMDNTMPVFSIDGADFVGVLKMPRYDLSLPVCADWGHITKYPCRFSGSVYDSTIKIGATSQKGQFDFYRELSVGDTVVFTDMEGNCYTYTVTNLRYQKHVDNEALNNVEAPLTIFIKNINSFEYLIVSCNVAY